LLIARVVGAVVEVASQGTRDSWQGSEMITY
jgi:hypothetical protein